jgi:hypothetical protein
LPRFFGLDLTSSPERPSAAVVLGLGLKAVYVGQSSEDEAILDMVSRLQPLLVAIDSPLTLPLGLDCLEETCPCQPLNPEKGRRAERDLNREGIWCYSTTKRSFIKAMVYRGIDLREALEGRGFRVVEVYPYATKRRLWGRDIPKKTTPEGREFFRERLLALVPSLEFFRQQLSHHMVDAALAAYTAYLYCRGEGEALGDPREGQIVVPRLTPGQKKN